MTETSRDRSALLGTLLKVKHRKLFEYVDDVYVGAVKDPELFAHVIAWNEANGKVRDTKAAFPIIALRTDAMKDRELTENAMAHLAKLGPRELVRAYQFNKELSTVGCASFLPFGGHIRNGQRGLLQDVIQAYLRTREAEKNWWTAAVVRNRTAMKTLYTVSHLKPSERAQRVLFDRKYAGEPVFTKIKAMSKMSPLEAGGFILRNKIPFTVALGAGVKLDNDFVLLALVQSMTGAELITATAQLNKLKSFKLGSVQEAYKEAVGKVTKDKRVSVGKVSRAIGAAAGQMVPDIFVTKNASTEQLERIEQLVKLKEKAAQAAGPIKGDWLILADRSQSMGIAVKQAVKISALLAHRVEGKVHLVFFNDVPQAFDVTGKTLDQIEHVTRHVTDSGTTSIGCGLRYLSDKKIGVDGIVLVSDGGENRAPWFHEEYKKLDPAPALIYLKLFSDLDRLYKVAPGTVSDQFGLHLQENGITYQAWNLGAGVDDYALENIVAVIKPGSYGMLDTIMETPLVLLRDVFKGVLFPGQIMELGRKA